MLVIPAIQPVAIEELMKLDLSQVVGARPIEPLHGVAW